MHDPSSRGGALLALSQLEQLLQDIGKLRYTQPLELLEGHSIGQHVRHLLEFYQCLIDGLPGKTVNYAGRSRASVPETDPGYALSMVQEIKSALVASDSTDLIEVVADYPHQQLKCLSSLGRELMFAFDHAIHHLAIIRVAVRHYWPEYSIPDHLGLAPSTVRHKTAQ